MNTFKTKLNNAFKEMRKQGFVARQNYMCCATCAGYGLTIDTVEAIQAGKKKKEDIKGCIFYHHQDTEGFKRNHSLYLAYGPMESTEFGTIGLSNEAAGKIVCEILKNNSIEYEWNGNGNTRILVKEARDEIQNGLHNEQ